MAKPLLSAEEIYDEALRLLHTEGAAALNARNLSTRLRCSMNTLYRQVGNREALIRGVVARAFGTIDLDFSTDASWEDSVHTWCFALRGALINRPELCALMTVKDRGVAEAFAGRLIGALKGHGFSHEDAIEAACILHHVTISVTLADAAASSEWSNPEVFATTVRWLTKGMAERHG